jgi:hypothetical protein
MVFLPIVIWQIDFRPIVLATLQSKILVNLIQIVNSI